MEKITVSDFEKLMDTYRAKRIFYEKMSEYKQKGFLNRLFSRAPVDPAVGFIDSELFTLCSHAFTQAFPELNFDTLDNNGRRCICRTRLKSKSDGTIFLVSKVSDGSRNAFHDEYFELKKGYGFIHAYQHSDNLSDDNRNRQNAHNSFMSARMEGDPFKRYYNCLDRFRQSGLARNVSDDVTPSEELVKSSFLKRISDHYKSYNRQEKEIFDECGRIERTKISGISSIIDARLSMKRYMRSIVAPLNDLSAYESVKKHESYRYLFDSVDKAAIYNENRVGNQLLPLDEILLYSFMESKLDPHCKYDSIGTIHNFIKNAFDAGYSMSDVSDVVNRFGKAKGFKSIASGIPVDIKKDFDKASREFFNYVIDQADDGYYKLGTRQIFVRSQINVKSPGELFEEKLQNLLDNGGREFLNSPEAFKEKQLISDCIARPVKELIGQTVYTVLPDDVKNGILPPGVSYGLTEKSQVFVSFNGNNNRLIPDDGLILVKDKATDSYECFSRKSFDLIFKVNPDGSASRKEQKMTMKPGLRKKSSLKQS